MFSTSMESYVVCSSNSKIKIIDERVILYENAKFEVTSTQIKLNYKFKASESNLFITIGLNARENAFKIIENVIQF